MRIMLLFPFLFFGAVPPHGHIGAQMFDPYFGLFDGGLYGAYNPYLYSSSLGFGQGNSLVGFGVGGFGSPNPLFNPLNPFGAGQSAILEFPLGSSSPLAGIGNNGFGQHLNPFSGGLLSALGIGNGNNGAVGGGNILPQSNPFQIGSNNNVGNSAPFGRQIRSRYGSTGGLFRGGSSERISSPSIFSPSGGQGGCNSAGGGLFAFGRDCGSDTKKE